MKAPSVKKLTEAFDLPAKDAKLIRKFAKAEDDRDELEELVEKVPGTDAYVRSLFSSPYGSAMWRVTVVLHAINEILEGHGVEVIGSGAGPDDMDPPPYEYINMGDTYDTTLIYDREKDRLFISTMGDVAESMPREENPGPGDAARYMGETTPVTRRLEKKARALGLPLMIRRKDVAFKGADRYRGYIDERGNSRNGKAYFQCKSESACIKEIDKLAKLYGGDKWGRANNPGTAPTTANALVGKLKF